MNSLTHYLINVFQEFHSTLDPLYTDKKGKVTAFNKLMMQKNPQTIVQNQENSFTLFLQQAPRKVQLPLLCRYTRSE